MSDFTTADLEDGFNEHDFATPPERAQVWHSQSAHQCPLTATAADADARQHWSDSIGGDTEFKHDFYCCLCCCCFCC